MYPRNTAPAAANTAPTTNHPAGAHAFELRFEVAEVAALGRAPGRHGGGVEEEHHRPLRELVLEAEG